MKGVGFMDFERLKKFKPHAPLTVIEKNLSLIPEIRRKTVFTEEDLHVDFTSKRLTRAEIEIPIFKESFIRPFHFKGKFVRYEMRNLGGGFYHFKLINGKMEPKRKDRRYPDEEVDRKNGGEFDFWIGYNYEKRHYYVIEDEAAFKEKYTVFERVLMDDDIQELLWQFEQFISSFLTDSYLLKNNLYGIGVKNKTVRDYYTVLSDLKNALPMLQNYHRFLNMMNDINDSTLNHISNTLNHWEKTTNHYVSYIEQELDLDWTDQEIRTHYDKTRHVTDFYGDIQTKFWTRGYYIDPFEKKAFPNFLEIHYQRQLASGNHFENNDSLRLQKRTIFDKNIEQALQQNVVIFVKNE